MENDFITEKNRQFDEQFEYFYDLNDEKEHYDNLKSFLTKSLSQAISYGEAKMREEVEKGLPNIEKAHTYASENADIYRAYDRGQESYQSKVKSLLASLKKKI